MGESYCQKSTLQVSDCGLKTAKEMLNSPVQALRASRRSREKKEGSEILNQRSIALPLVESLSQSGDPTLRSDERKSGKMWDTVFDSGHWKRERVKTDTPALESPGVPGVHRSSPLHAHLAAVLAG